MKTMNQLRVIGVPWHTAHQYELAKLFGQYDMLVNHYREWGDVSRPMPDNMKNVLTFNPDDYDLAILHVDQQTVQPLMNKYKLFKDFEEATRGMKRVVINHMTPYDDRLSIEETIAAMKELVGDIPMITNSKQAAAQWGWGTPIIHGMDVDQWHDLPKEPRVVTSLSTGGMSTAYRRELLLATIEIVKEAGLDFVWIQSDKKFQSFEDYRDYIGRSLIYFNPTWQSPMPRSRTEAALSGCCIISTRHHDWDSYIEDGKNGFIIKDNPQSAARLIIRLLTEGYQEAVQVGKAGREMARKNFNHERWAVDWAAFLANQGISAHLGGEQ